MSDSELLHEVDEAVRRERDALPYLLACLADVERRRLQIDTGYHDMFDYCVRRLKYAPGAAIRRIYSARAAVKFPEIYALLKDGALSLGAVSILHPHLTSANASTVLSRASGKSKREIEALVAELVAARDAAVKSAEFEASPQSELALSSAKYESGIPAASSDRGENPVADPATKHAPSRDTIRVEAPGVLRIGFSATPALQDKLELARTLMGGYSCNRIELLLEALLEYFLARRDPSRRKPSAPRHEGGRRTRRIPRWVKDAVWKRDSARCAYEADDGTRCGARSGLEFDHIVPWALGGASNDPKNIRLLCRTHNLHLARRVFGDRVPSARVSPSVP